MRALQKVYKIKNAGRRFFVENCYFLCILKNMKQTTKILVFADVHGNYSVLEQLEKTKDYQTADIKIFLGDAIMGFSRPNDCLEFLAKNGCKCVLGNNDSYVCDHIPQVDLQEFSQEKIEQVEFMEKLVTPQNKNFVNSWPKQLYLRFGERTLFFTHYMWEQYNQDYNVVDTPQVKSFETRQQMFESIDADYIFFGHDHAFEYFTNNKKWFYAIGALGVKNPGEYAVVEVDEQNIKVEYKTLPSDYDKEYDLAKSAGYTLIKPR